MLLSNSFQPLKIQLPIGNSSTPAAITRRPRQIHSSVWLWSIRLLIIHAFDQPYVGWVMRHDSLVDRHKDNSYALATHKIFQIFLTTFFRPCRRCKKITLKLESLFQLSHVKFFNQDFVSNQGNFNYSLIFFDLLILLINIEEKKIDFTITYK